MPDSLYVSHNLNVYYKYCYLVQTSTFRTACPPYYDCCLARKNATEYYVASNTKFSREIDREKVKAQNANMNKLLKLDYK